MNKNKRYKVILFDMDGTLVDSDPMLLETFKILYDKYRPGFSRPKEEIAYFSGPPIGETLAHEFPNVDSKEILDDFKKTSRIFYDTHIFTYPHEREVLLKLKEDGFKLGVVTNKMHDLSIVAINNLKLDNIFDVVIGFDDVSNGKPDKEGILKALDLLGYKKEDALYVGDNKIDLDTANNAGVDSCLVYWGPRVLSKELKPTIKIKSYLDLLEALYE